MPRPRTIFLLALLLLGLAGCLYIFLRPHYKFHVELLAPKAESILGEPFTLSFFYTGSTKAEAFEVWVDGEAYTPKPDFFLDDRSYGRYYGGSCVGMCVQPIGLAHGWHDLQVNVKAGGGDYPSDTVRMYFLPAAQPTATAPPEKIAAMRQFFSEPFNDFIIANYNSYIYKQRGQDPRDDEYRQSWEKVLQADISEKLKTPIKMYIDKAQKYIDGEEEIAGGAVSLPIDLLNHALLEEGLPFYAYLYYKHFPIVCEITDTIRVELGEHAHQVLILEQVTRISGGWTPPTLYGHSRSTYAVIHDELHRKKMAAMLACLRGQDSACEDYFNPAMRALPYKQQLVVLDALQAELTAYFAARDQSLDLPRLHRLHLESTAIHEALHLEERYHGTAVAGSIDYLVEGFHIRPRDRDNRDQVTKAEKRIAVNLRGQSVEYNAYLTELVYGKGMQRHLLTHLFNNARYDYECRMILANVGRKAGIWRNEELVYKSWDRNESDWTDLLMDILALPLGELQEHLEALYQEDYGKMLKVSVR